MSATIALRQAGSHASLAVKRGLTRALAHPFVGNALAPMVQDSATIFMLHRVADPVRGIAGHSPIILRSALAFLRREHYHLASLAQVFRDVEEGRPLAPKTVVFTFDDGYLEQATIAAPILAEFDCPLTIFLITGFIDGELLPWDYRVQYIFARTQRERLQLRFGDQILRYNLRGYAQRERALSDFRARCKRIADSDLPLAVARLAVAADVDVPNRPTPPYMPMTWDMARRLEAQGVDFAPHSVSHGILSRMTDDKAQYEIAESWRRLQQELKRPVPIFGFPTGRKIDFGIREMKIIKQLGLKGAVTAEPGGVDPTQATQSPYGLFRIRRYSFPPDLDGFVYCCSRFERVRELSVRHICETYGGKAAMLKHFAYFAYAALGGFARYRRIDLARVQRLVFVCKGNICRSPYAEARARAQGYAAISFGLDTTSGSTAYTDAVVNASARGLDLGRHGARTGDESQLTPHDLVICMEPQQAAAVAAKARAAGAQVTLLGLWAQPLRPYIQDPYGRNDAYFQKCFGIIDCALANLGRELRRVVRE